MRGAFRLRKKKPRPRVPKGVRIYAIGDIHGRADLLERTLNRIDADLASNPVRIGIQVFLGDYIDRGPASREVLDRLVREQPFISVGLSQRQPREVFDRLSDQSAYSWRLATLWGPRDTDVLWDNTIDQRECGDASPTRCRS